MARQGETESRISGEKAGEGGRTRVSPAVVERYLKGMDYPATKDSMLQHAKRNEAPQEVLEVLEKVPDREFDSPTDIATEIGNVE